MIEKSISYKTKVYNYVKEGIIRGHYQQGEALNERKLSEELGVSRTPIREALQSLATDGWVVNEPYKESVVRTFNVEYVLNAQKVRRALEILAVEDAVLNMTAEQKDRLRFYYEKQEENIRDYDPVVFMEYDRAFHEEIYRSSKNFILQDLLKNLNDIIRYFGIKVLMYPERSQETLYEHKGVLDAILEGNIERAREAMDNHLSRTGEAILLRSDQTEL